MSQGAAPEAMAARLRELWSRDRNCACSHPPRTAANLQAQAWFAPSGWEPFAEALSLDLLLA